MSADSASEILKFRVRCARRSWRVPAGGSPAPRIGVRVRLPAITAAPIAALVAPVLDWAARCQSRRPATDRIGDLLREARVAGRPAAIGRRPQRRDEFAVERAAKQRAISLAARLAAAPDRTIDRMLAEQRGGG